MPKPNKKRIEERTETSLRQKRAGKPHVPDHPDIEYEPPAPQNTISDAELERELTKLLSGQQGYGKNYRRPRPIKD